MPSKIASGPRSGRTCSRISAAFSASAREATIRAPFSTKAASGKPAASPAPASTTTSSPSFVERRQRGGDDGDPPLALQGVLQDGRDHPPAPHHRSSPSAGTCRRGCGRRTVLSMRADGGPELVRRAARAPGRRPARACTGASSRRRSPRARCAGAFFSGLSARSVRPSSMARISSRIAIIASQKRSSSAFDSLSVGSIISVPGTGKRHRRGVEAVVHQPLGDVLDLDARACP